MFGCDQVIKAQVIFACIYVVNFALVAWIYAVAAPRSFPPVLLPILSCSKRIHSIFALRLFNDGVATTLAHAGVLLFVHRRWTLGCILNSLSVATKMNFILYSPALAVLLLHELGLPGLLKHVFLCVVVQVRQPMPSGSVNSDSSSPVCVWFCGCVVCVSVCLGVCVFVCVCVGHFLPDSGHSQSMKSPRASRPGASPRWRVGCCAGPQWTHPPQSRSALSTCTM